MERTEPALAPQWLRCSGNILGGGSSVRHSDVPSSVNSIRSRYFRNSTAKDSPRVLDRSSSSNSRLSSSSNGSAKHPYSSFSSLNSNGSAKHPYSSFSRSQRDKNRDRDKEKSLLDDILERDSYEPIASRSSSMNARSSLRRSRSLVSRKPAEVLPNRGVGPKSSVSSQNGLTSGISSAHGSQKVSFEKDFPSLGTEEKQRVTGVKRILSPGLGPSVNSLSICNSGFLGCEKWTSALVEVPASLTNIGNGHPPLQQSTSNTSGLNMAEALSKHPAGVRATPQLPDKSQRLEELAIKQSRQLIPMTPSVPKLLVPSAADKLKQPKIALRTNEINVASRTVHTQPHSSHSSSQSRAGQSRPESSNTPHVGKFLVLKPVRENGVTNGSKDVSNDANGPVATMSPVSPTNSVVSNLGNKAARLSISSDIDRKHSQSLARSRSEFFNLMRRKASKNVSTDLSRSNSVVSSSSDHSTQGSVINSHAMKNGDEINDKVESLSDGHGSIYPDEEEAAFLKSLGWEENDGEDEGLTEEEINAFYQEYMNRMPSLKVCSNSQPSESKRAMSENES